MMRYSIVLSVMFLLGCDADSNIVSSTSSSHQGKAVVATEVDSGHTRGSETGDDGGGGIVAIEEDVNDGSGDSDEGGGTAENEGVSIYNDTQR